VLDGKLISPAEIVRIADLEPREVLLAKLAGAMKASMSGAVATFAALPAQMARLLAALEEKRTAQQPAADAQAAASEPAQATQSDEPAQAAQSGEPAQAAQSDDNES
jgi:large subunit ribosomal protein L10